MKILLSGRLTSFPIMFAWKKGIFKKYDIDVECIVRNNCMGNIHLLESGNYDAGEVSIIAGLLEFGKRKNINKTLFPGMLLSRFRYHYYPPNLPILKTHKNGFVPILHQHSTDRYVSEYYLRKRILYQGSIDWKVVPFYLQEKYFSSPECLGISGDIITTPFLSQLENRQFIHGISDRFLPSSMLVFSGRCLSNSKNSAVGIITSVLEANEILRQLDESSAEDLCSEVHRNAWYPDYGLNDIRNFLWDREQPLKEVLNHQIDDEEFMFLYEVVRPFQQEYLPEFSKRIIDPDLNRNEYINFHPGSPPFFNIEKHSERPLYRSGFGGFSLRKLSVMINRLMIDLLEGNFGERLWLNPVNRLEDMIQNWMNMILSNFDASIQDLLYRISKLDNLNSILEIKLDRSFIDLQFSEEKYRYLFEHSNEALLIVDADTGEVIDSNNKFRQLTGYSRTDLKQKNIFDLVGYAQKLKALFETSGPDDRSMYISDATLARKDRVFLDVDLNINSQLLGPSRKFQIQVVNRSEIQDAERLKHEFISNVSHELRSPMTNIQGYVELLSSLKEVKNNSNAKELISVIEKNIKRMNHLVNNLLKLEGNQNSGGTQDREIFSPAVVIREVLDQNLTMANEKGLLIVVNLDPSIKIEGYPFEFSQVVTNLFSNAVKYTEKGEIKITLSRAPQNDKIGVLKVKDTGIGFDPKYSIAIFERFFRVPGPDNKKIGGTGLGLAISQSLLEKIGGIILAESEIGKGSSFTVNFPAVS